MDCTSSTLFSPQALLSHTHPTPPSPHQIPQLYPRDPRNPPTSPSKAAPQYSQTPLGPTVNKNKTHENFPEGEGWGCYRFLGKWIFRAITKIIQHDFSHSQDTKVILLQGDKKKPDPLPFSAYTVEIDIIGLYPLETARCILLRVRKSPRDKSWAI